MHMSRLARCLLLSSLMSCDFVTPNPDSCHNGGISCADGYVCNAGQCVQPSSITGMPGGTYLFSKRLGGTGDDFPAGIGLDDSGNLLLAGVFSETADFGGGPLMSAGLEDLFIAKYAPDGTHIFSRRYGTDASEYALGLAVDPSGNL